MLHPGSRFPHLNRVFVSSCFYPLLYMRRLLHSDGQQRRNSPFSFSFPLFHLIMLAHTGPVLCVLYPANLMPLPSTAHLTRLSENQSGTTHCNTGSKDGTMIKELVYKCESWTKEKEVAIRALRCWRGFAAWRNGTFCRKGARVGQRGNRYSPLKRVVLQSEALRDAESGPRRGSYHSNSPLHLAKR